MYKKWLKRSKIMKKQCSIVVVTVKNEKQSKILIKTKKKRKMGKKLRKIKSKE